MANKVEERINHNYYKQIADKISQQLAKIHDSPLSNKRWVWELVQNAKDVENKFGRVSIRIELWQDKLVFSHNGNYFTDGNITGLIQQVSSKDSENEGETKQTGKFGTGFITTHLLSRIIDVRGVVKNPNTNEYQRFKLHLDRSAQKSEDLIQSITDNLEWVKGLDKGNFEDFPIVDNYDNRDEKSFDTSFTYYLNDDSLRAAQIGLSDLINTLPITMVSLPKVKSVVVVNHVTNETQEYTCNSDILQKTEDAEIKKSVIDINENKKYYLTYEAYENGEHSVALSIETKIDNSGNYMLVKRDKEQPVLFRDFPLIGSECFYFPYMLNGFEFNPTETRNGILLNSDQPNPKKNRKIIEKAVNAVFEFNDWLLSQGASNTYLLASSQKPIPQEPWDEIYAKPWIESLQKQWRNRLLSQALVETSTGYRKVVDIRIPYYGSKEANKKFYSFLEDFMQEGVLPLSEQQEAWSDVINAENTTWQVKLRYTRQDFFEDLQRVGCMRNLCTRLGHSKGECYVWLNRLYKFIEEQGDEEYLEKYPVVPNQSGDFCLLGDLYSDSAQRIPNKLKDICISLLDRNFYDELISEEIEDQFFKKNRQYTLNNLITDINMNIRNANEKRNIVSQNEWDVVSKGVYGILTLKTDNEKDEQALRDRMYAFVQDFVQYLPNQESIEGLPNSLWTESDIFVLKSTPQLVEKYASSLEELVTKMLSNARGKTVEESIFWLNEYGQLCKINNYNIPQDLKIFPNQNGELCSLSCLHYDNFIPEELKELAYLATNEDWRSKLLDTRILGYANYNVISTKDIYESIKKSFETCIDHNIKLQVAKEAISLIPASLHFETSDNTTIYKLARRYDKTIKAEKVLGNSEGFYWEIFASFMLRYICKSIAESVNINTLASNMGIDEDAAINYTDEIIDFAETRYGKRYSKYVECDYGIWVNQNDDFCTFNEIYKDDNISDELKDIANNQIVNQDYRAILLRTDMRCSHYLPNTSVKNNKDVLVAIDDVIRQYIEEKRSFQDPCFAGLVFNLNKLINDNPKYKNDLKVFCSNKDKLIVGTIGDKETLAIVGAIVSNPDKLELINEINKHSKEDIQQLLQKLEIGEAYSKETANTIQQIAKEFPNFDFAKLLEKLRKETGDFELTAIYNDSANERKVEIGDKGEAFVYQKLLMQYSKEEITWSNLCKEGEAGDRIVEMNNIEYKLKTTRHDYDFKISSNKRVIYIEVKSTIGKLEQSSTYPLYFETKEWKHVDIENATSNSVHLIARVFDVEGTPSVYYLQQTKLV